MSNGSRRGPRTPRAASWLPLGIASLAAAGLLLGVWLAAPDTGSQVHTSAGAPEQTVERTRAMSPEYACLLTDSHGVTGEPAAAVWAGVREAAASANARASYLALLAAGPPDAQANGLIAARCTVVLAVGKKPVAAVESIAANAPPSVHLAVADPGASTAKVAGFTASRAEAKSVTARLLTGRTS